MRPSLFDLASLPAEMRNGPIYLCSTSSRHMYCAARVSAPWHPALAALAVHEHETAASSDGVVIRGTVRFHGDIRPYFDPGRMVMGIEAGNQERRISAAAV